MAELDTCRCGRGEGRYIWRYIDGTHDLICKDCLKDGKAMLKKLESLKGEHKQRDINHEKE